MKGHQPTNLSRGRAPTRGGAADATIGPSGGSSRWRGGPLGLMSLAMLLVGCALGFLLNGRAPLPVLGSSPGVTEAAKSVVGQTSPQPVSLADLLSMDDAALDRLDPLEVDLAVARTIPGCESLDVASCKRTVNQWAEHVRAETERHLYKFYENPGNYKNSLAYFKSLLLATVVGQDFETEILTSQVLDESGRYPWSETHRSFKKLTALRPAFTRVPATQKGPS